MDIVKYKAWNKNLNCYEKLALKFIEINGVYVCNYNSNIIEIMEFVNAYDKEGNELYEFDILEYSNGRDIITGYIKWDEKELGYIVVTIDKTTNINPRINNYTPVIGYKKLSDIISISKKIGNAFENNSMYNKLRGGSR